MTPLMHIPLVHDTFPTPFDNLAINFGRVNVFLHSKIKLPMHLTMAGLVTEMVLYEAP
jgi:hypothetical protein